MSERYVNGCCRTEQLFECHSDIRNTPFFDNPTPELTSCLDLQRIFCELCDCGIVKPSRNSHHTEPTFEITDNLAPLIENTLLIARILLSSLLCSCGTIRNGPLSFHNLRIMSHLYVTNFAGQMLDINILVTMKRMGNLYEKIGTSILCLIRFTGLPLNNGISFTPSTWSVKCCLPYKALPRVTNSRSEEYQAANVAPCIHNRLLPLRYLLWFK